VKEVGAMQSKEKLVLQHSALELLPCTRGKKSAPRKSMTVIAL